MLNFTLSCFHLFKHTKSFSTLQSSHKMHIMFVSLHMAGFLCFMFLNFTSSEMASQNSGTDRCFLVILFQSTHLFSVGMWNGIVTLKNSLAVFYKIKVCLPNDSVIPLLYIYPRWLKTCLHIKICALIFIATLFSIPKKL